MLLIFNSRNVGSIWSSSDQVRQTHCPDELPTSKSSEATLSVAIRTILSKTRMARRRLEILGDNNWMNGAWEVKGEEHAVPVRGVVYQLVRWYLGGTFRPRTDKSDWCRHIFRESNKAADTHANCLMDNGDFGPGAQWEAVLNEKLQTSPHILTSFDGARRESGLGAQILWLRDETGSFEKISCGGRVLRNASAMTAEREALRMGIEFDSLVSDTNWFVRFQG